MFRLVTVCLVLLLSVEVTVANDVVEQIHFESHVRPILKQHCLHCHGEEGFESGLDLRQVRLMIAGGESGPAVVSGQPAESLLYQRIRDGEMPPDENKLLSATELSTIRDWIAAGARTARPESDDAVDFITAEERSHWSFQPIARPELPAVQAFDSAANPIDVFLLARLESQGFTFAARASPQSLIRRLHFTLHGLPPTPEEAAAFTEAAGPAGWQHWIDNLLASPRYGERWARHWLDVAGYADSEGYSDADAQRPHAWRYRDYVIRALNSDKPFNQFVQEQLAGDEMISSPLDNLSARDVALLTATGFLRSAPDGTGGAVPDAEAARNDTIADTIKIVSSSLMAMTVGCAQCHNHRYDPISQVDYYRFRAIFEPAFDWQQWRRPRERLVSLYTDQDRLEAAAIETEAKKIDAERLQKQADFISATFEKQLAALPAEVHETARIAHRAAAAQRTVEQKALFKKYPTLNVTPGSLYLYDSKAADQLKKLAERAAKVRGTKPPEHFVRALTEKAGRIPETHLFRRGDHQQQGEVVTPGGLTVLSKVQELGEIPIDAEACSTTGRRLAFAQRLTHPSHPLTARVIANRVWLHHFGRGLVASPSDFGVLGQQPTHPQLLDWLATELIDSGWSLKHLHRLILASNAWQQQVRNNDRLERLDPDNELYGGAQLLRLDAETIRDSLLAVSGQLNTEPFGPAVPVMADRVGRFVIGKENLNAGRPGANIDMRGEDNRRSIFIQIRRSRPLSLLDAFDQPAMSPNCDRRRSSTSSTQSLMLLNSDLFLRYARAMADRLERESVGDLRETVRLAWQLVYSRFPEAAELEAAVEFLRDQTALFAKETEYQPKNVEPPKRAATQEALAVMCQMLLGSNEFLYVN